MVMMKDDLTGCPIVNCVCKQTTTTNKITMNNKQQTKQISQMTRRDDVDRLHYRKLCMLLVSQSRSCSKNTNLQDFVMRGRPRIIILKPMMMTVMLMLVMTLVMTSFDMGYWGSEGGHLLSVDLFRRDAPPAKFDRSPPPPNSFLNAALV